MSLAIRVMYIFFALALLIGLAGIASLPASVDAGTSQWAKVTTPSEKNLTLLPGSEIIDFAIAKEGQTIYAVGQVPTGRAGNLSAVTLALWKSSDGGATWKDYSAKLLRANVGLAWAGSELNYANQVCVVPNNVDFVVVAGFVPGVGSLVLGSTNGGSKFAA